MATQRRKARKLGLPNDVVSFADIYKRDGGKCWLCHKAVSLTTKIKARQATLDHVIPIARGGGTVRDNMALAHRGCNSSKCAKVLTLF